MPVDRGAIEAQLREIGESERWWEHREFRELPNVLHAEERIRALTSGNLLGARGPHLNPAAARWLMVVTSHRLLCLKQERFARKQIDVAPRQITRIYQRSRLRAFEITIDTPLRAYRMRIPKADALRFSGALGDLMSDPPAHRVLPPAAQAQEPAPRLPALPSAGAPRERVGMVRRFTRRFSQDYVPREPLERLQITVERLQDDLERLQERVNFLEDLLQKQSNESFLARSSADS